MRDKIRKCKTIKQSPKVDEGGTLETRAAKFYWKDFKNGHI